MMAVLQTIDLKKYYGEGENQVKALDGICLEIEEGEIHCDCRNFWKRKIYTFTYARRTGYTNIRKSDCGRKGYF